MTRKPQTHFTRIAPAVVGLSFALPQPLTGIAFADDPCAPHWDNTIGQPGVSGNVRALVVFDDGGGPALFAGGNIGTIGGQSASHLAKWDDTQWTPILPATNCCIGVFLVHEGEGGPTLYVGGTFSTAGGQPANRIARWDAKTGEWSPLGGGIDGNSTVVSALALFDDGFGMALYVGGSFSAADGVEATYLAKWDGQQWSGIDAIVPGPVRDLVVFDDGTGAALYVAGQFFNFYYPPDEQSIVYKWDGSTWHGLGGGDFYMEVRALVVFDDGSGEALYGVGSNQVVKWSPANAEWLPMGAGLPGGVYDLVVFDDGGGPALYAAGAFTFAGGLTLNRIAKWNGSSWSALGSGMNNTISAVAVFDDGNGPALFAGGSFTTAGGMPANKIAAWRVPTPVVPGDLDCDGSVGVADLLALLAAWDGCPDCTPGACPADLTGDCNVGVADLLTLLANWG